MASVSFPTASVDRTALASGALAAVIRGRDSLFPPSHVCSCPSCCVKRLPHPLLSSVFPRTLLARTSSRKPSLMLSSGVSSGSPEPWSHGVVIIYFCVSPDLFMSLSMVVCFSMPCVSSSGLSTELDVRLSSLICMEPSP